MKKKKENTKKAFGDSFFVALSLFQCGWASLVRGWMPNINSQKNAVFRKEPEGKNAKGKHF